MKGVAEVGSQANERVEEEEVRALDEGILVKTGGQENDTGLRTIGYGVGLRFIISNDIVL